MTVNDTLQTWKITLITPLHVGDGEELQRNMDYVADREGLKVFELDTLLESLKDNPAAIGEMGGTGFDLARFMRDYRISANPRYVLTISGKKPPESLRRFLKNGYGQPYLAGSTLKGAVRTALWTGLDRSRLPSVSNFRAFKGAVNKVSGTDPHHDFLRPLQISDSVGLDPAGPLVAEEIKFFNLQRENRAGWKDFGSKRTLDRFEDAAGIYVETLKPRTDLFVQVHLDAFLRSDSVRKALKLPQSSGLQGFAALARAINTHSLEMARAELDFFARFGGTANAAAEIYGQLVGGIQGLMKQENPDTFIVRMAWGSGWRGMTGNWIDEGDMAAVRRETRLGKRDVPVFPKTRRLAMAGGVPSQPLGWAVVSMTVGAGFVGQSREALKALTMGQPASAAVKPVEAALKPAEPLPKAESKPAEPAPPVETETW
ncbi:MAG: RAMP superfamily CRISPR-associated protein, partial [Thermodesulfobacteriota bacterium]